MIFVTGEAGIGKTTLVDAFLAQMAPHQPLGLGRGQCIDHYGPGEAYLPLLAAFGEMGQGASGADVIEVFRQHAPGWLLQLPALWSPHELPMLQQRAYGATRERMLRELAEAVEILAQDRPVVLVLEDLHWSDASTLDWLAYVARRRAPARLLVLGTYRPIDAVVREHPIRAVTQELRVHGQCEELLLPYLSEAGVAAYVTQRCGEAVCSPALVRALHQRTNGNPMFLVTRSRGDGAAGETARGRQPTGQRLAPHAAAVMVDIPESLRQVIDQQLDQLHPEERACLEVASVAGREFAVAAVAAGSDQCGRDGSPLCSASAAWPICPGWRDRQHGPMGRSRHATALRMISISRWPTSGSGRPKESVSTANWPARLETAYGPRAVGACRRAGVALRTGARVCAGHPVSPAGRRDGGAPACASGGHRLSAAGAGVTPDPPRHPSSAASKRYTCMWPWVARSWPPRGQAAPEVEQTYSQAYALCQQVEDTAQLLPVLAGLRLFYVMQAAHQTAQELGQRLLTLAERHHDQAFQLEAQVALGGGHFFLGQFEAALARLQQGMACEDVPAPPRPGLSITPRSVVMSLPPGCCGASAILTRPWSTVRKLSPRRNACRTLTF